MSVKNIRKNYWIIAYIFFLIFIFGLYTPANTQNANAEPAYSVYLGGFPIGLTLKPKGVIVVGPAPIETELGSVVAKSPLSGGDIIESVNGAEIRNIKDIDTALSATEDMTAKLGVRRGTALLDITVNLIREDMTGEKRLGLRVRESVAGVGTVTYVKQDGSFGCLGHPITLENESFAPCFEGYSFDCKILGCNKGVRGRAGELKGAFSSSVPNGTLYKNCKSGVFGKFKNYEGGELTEVAPRQSVRPGKAYILANINNSTERYDIEIVKASSQNSVSDKSMIIRVTDKRLITATGGIVQGMSGSPIIQNNRLVGAVTHVFVSDPTKGYGIYADWMMEN